MHVESRQFSFEGPAFAEATLDAMVRLAREAADYPLFRNLLAFEDETDAERMAEIFRKVKEKIRFAHDQGGEVVQHPQVTLNRGAGDCDDTATLVAAALRAADIPAKVRAVKLKPGAKFHHVYALGYDRATGQWIPLDTQLRFGETREVLEIMERRV
jgi:transglutaminase-like putative cysteine protease